MTWLRAVRSTLAFVAVTLALLAACEGGARVVGRLRNGAWPTTQSALIFDRLVASVRALFRPDPWLNAAPRQGAHIAPGPGVYAGFNALGYRSPERPLAKPPGTRRIVCEGGSTTFDTMVTIDERSWPWQLEQLLADERPPVEVWNAGVPCWTSLENALSLVVRDLDLAPDVVVLYQGINDLQVAVQVPFDRQYEGAHPDLVRRTLAIDPAPLPLWERSVFVEQVRTAIFGPRPLVMAPVRRAEPLARIPDEALDTFRRNVHSILSLARGVGARLILVTQPLRLRPGMPAEDRRELEQWIPGLTADVTPRELDRLSDVLRAFATEPDVTVVDAARDVHWVEADFKDLMHFGDAGSAKMAAFLAPRLRAVLAAMP